MGLGTTLVIAFFTGVVGAVAGAWLAPHCVAWYDMNTRDGGDGYFLVALSTLGVFTGFVIGAVTSRMVTSGFWPAQGYALLWILSGFLITALLARWLGEIPPLLNDQPLLLQVELKCPRGWQPDRKLKTEYLFCSLQSQGRFPGNQGRVVDTSISLRSAIQTDPEWILPCSVKLFSSRASRHLLIVLGSAARLEFPVSLPAEPGLADLAWTNWMTGSSGYQLRCRVKPSAAVQKETDDANQAASDAILAAAAAVPSDAPLDRWLHFFEDGESGLPPSERGKTIPPRATQTLSARASELAAPLRSADTKLARRAIFAAATLDHLPTELAAPLAEAGSVVVELIKAAQAAEILDDTDLEPATRAKICFYQWTRSMTQFGAARLHLAALGQIAVQLTRGKLTTELLTLRNYVDQDIARVRDLR